MSVVFFLLGIQWISCLICLFQISSLKERKGYFTDPITIIRPLYGYEYNIYNNIASCLNLGYGKIIFCLPNKEDKAHQILLEVLESKPTPNVEILFGLDNLENPKLANLAKSISVAPDGLLIFTDSNTELDKHYLRRAVCFHGNIGAISAPPIAYDTQNFWAELEAAFLNTHQTRWQYVADFFGFAFAQGKNLILTKETLTLLGGLRALDKNFSEDAALTKEIRKLKLRIALMYPTKMALGSRKLKEIWSRQSRWSKLRRKTFLLEYLPEICSGGLPFLIMMLFFQFPFWIILGMLVLFYIPEIGLSYLLNWNKNIFAILVRDLVIPIVWLSGWGNRISWRGHYKDLSCE